jgi:pimeloyl-ACP methyl ester carboxylesterase
MSRMPATPHDVEPGSSATALTRFVEADGVTFAHRRFGAPGEAPLVMLQHFRGNLDSWDPVLTDGLARRREVILVDYPGLGSSGGRFGPTIADAARSMIGFVGALGLTRVDVLGFSVGGFVAQEIALIRPALVRRLVLAATGPKGGPAMHGWVPDIADAARLERFTPESLLHIFFTDSEESRAKGTAFIGRFTARTDDRDAQTDLAARDAQYDAIVEWGIPDHGALQRLTAIAAPTLIIQGDRDRMIPTKLSHLMAGLIPHATIRLYPDAAHAFLFQEPEQVADDVNAFLDGDGGGLA